jgi:hypothetical protein
MTPEAFDSLSKQELIALVLAQMEQIRLLTARVEELEARLNIPPKTPGNSSLPPSQGKRQTARRRPKRSVKAGTVDRRGQQGEPVSSLSGTVGQSAKRRFSRLLR